MDVSSRSLVFSAFCGMLMGAVSGCTMMKPAQLRCEYLENPLGVDVLPRLSWLPVSDERGAAQTAYQILVAGSQDKLAAGEGDLWDSGKVAGDQSIHIAYGGKPLTSGQRVYWKVRLWDQSDRESPWSAPAYWQMGLLEPQRIKARWIGKRDAPRADQPLAALPAALLRKEFTARKQVRRATLTASALGVYEIRINGRRVGDHVLAPEWTNYHKRVQYQTYDVTTEISEGANAIGAMLGDGWYAGRLGISHIDKELPLRGFYGRHPHLLVQLDIEYQDGTQDRILSDETWKSTTEGPIRKACILDGEVYDARMEQAGWDSPGFNAREWQGVHILHEMKAALVAQLYPPIRITQELKPVKILEPSPGLYVVDFGQNIAGWCRIQVNGPAGTAIRLRHAEVLEADGSGNIYRDNLRMKPYEQMNPDLGARQEDQFILRGEGTETFEPHFTYHGFRYVEVHGWPGKLAAESIVARAVHSDCPIAGSFECSSDLLNKLMSNIVWTHRDNMHGVPTDCPQRDERMGWMGDMLVFAQPACFNMDMAAFFQKWVRDISDDQTLDGRYPDFAPMPYNKEKHFSGVPSWGDAGIIVPWRTYVNYGDTRIIEGQFDSMKRWVDWIHQHNPELLWKNNRNNDYGDWLNGDTLKLEGFGYPAQGAEMPKEVLATAFFQHSASLLSRMAGIIGRNEDASKYGRLAEDIKAAFIKAYVKDDGHVEGHTQAGYALALDFDLIPPNLRDAAARLMVQRIEDYKWHISTGFQTTVKLMNELSRNGYTDVAYRLINNRTIPSWGYTIDHGGTTIWERWDGYVEGRGYQDPSMNSFNHYAIGAVGEWMYRSIIGINPDEEHPGYKRFTIRPRPGGGLTWAKGSYHSIRGHIASHWQIEADTIHLTVVVPPSTTATVFVPATDAASVREGNGPAASAPGLKFLRDEHGAAVYEAQAGTYRFTAKLPQPARTG